ncbi:MAG: hypothetical protein N2C14_30285, partial [Planctomycetales bacterium]
MSKLQSKRSARTQAGRRPARSGKDQPDSPTPWSQRTMVWAGLGSVLNWAAFPPLDFGWLAWFALIPWLMLIRREELEGKRPYRWLWAAGFAFWLTSVYWLSLPHPATFMGCIAISMALACYPPVFVLLSRTAVHRFKIPLIVAAPVVWAGLEYWRAHFLTGFAFAMLGHTQRAWISLIQVADLGGAYAVGFLVAFVGACLARMIPCGR